MAKTVLEMNNISKDYFGNKVLKDINLNIKEGHIHALLGENGAGKSTLMNILFGMEVIHSTGGYNGEVIFNGEKINIKSPKEAMEYGIGMVHQEFMLIPEFTLTENIKLNREITKNNPISFMSKSLKTLDYKKMNKDARLALNTVGLNLSEKTKVAGLPVGYMQFIEIAREIDKTNIKLLVFDEPTAVLTESEASSLMETMKEIADRGIAIIFITHRLDEVMEVADEITILRDGELVGVREKGKTNIIELAELMVGRKVESVNKYESQDIKEEKTALSIKNFFVDMPGEKVKGIDLDIKEGEILGVAGLAGQGKIGIANGVMGLFGATGEVYMGDEKLELNNPISSLKNGIAFVSEDRRGVGLLLDESIENNIVATAMSVKGKYFKGISPFLIRDGKSIRKIANSMIKNLDIRCIGPTQYTRRLSGGNQQKVCIARALALEPKILFVSEPTRGIDIGAKKIVLELLYKLSKEKGITVIITSSELAELRAVCDRIAVIAEGKISGILKPDDNDAKYGILMSGLKEV